MNKKLSVKIFIISQIIIFTFGLIFLAGLYYILNVAHQPLKGTYSSLGGPVTTKPTTLILELDGPDDNTLTFKPSLIVSGKTLPNLDVLISSNSDDQVVQTKTDGGFTATIDLKEGINNLSATVFDKTGDQKTIDRTIYYSKEKI